MQFIGSCGGVMKKKEASEFDLLFFCFFLLNRWEFEAHGSNKK